MEYGFVPESCYPVSSEWWPLWQHLSYWLVSDLFCHWLSLCWWILWKLQWSRHDVGDLQNMVRSWWHLRHLLRSSIIVMVFSRVLLLIMKAVRLGVHPWEHTNHAVVAVGWGVDELQRKRNIGWSRTRGPSLGTRFALIVKICNNSFSIFL